MSSNNWINFEEQPPSESGHYLIEVETIDFEEGEAAIVICARYKHEAGYWLGGEYDIKRWKIIDDWVPVSIKPVHNVGVLVFIPDEDDHITSGMWDVSNKWVLLDEYRTPECELATLTLPTQYTIPKSIKY